MADHTGNGGVVRDILIHSTMLMIGKLHIYSFIGIIVFVAVFVPPFAVIIVIRLASPGSEILFDVSIRLWVLVVPVIAYQIAAASIIRAATNHLDNRPTEVFASIRHAFTAAWPVFWIWALAFTSVTAGLFVLLVPGIILAIMVFPAIPTAVIERPGIVASLIRGADLTNGYKWAVFVILFVVGFLQFLAFLPVTWIQWKALDGNPVGFVYLLSFVGFSAMLHGVFGVTSFFVLRRANGVPEAGSIADVFD